MLYLTRKVGEAVVINNEIEVRVVELRGRTVKLGFVFPQHASVLREEVFAEVTAANREAVATDDVAVPTIAVAKDPEGER